MRVVRLTAAALVVTFAWPGAASPQSPEPDARAGRIDGRIVTPYAELLQGATVTLATRAGSSPVRTATSTAGGVFTFEGVPAGTYVVSASLPGYSDREIVPSGLVPAPEVILTDGESRRDVELVLRRTGSVAGRILKPDGTPAPNVQVTVAVRDGGRLTALTDWRTMSEWDGRYEIDGVPPGEFLVLVQPAPPGTAPATALPVDVPPAPLAFEPTLYPGVPDSEPGTTVVVYEGVATEGIDVWLMPAPQRFTVSGRVFWPEDLKVERVTIEYGGPPDVRSGIWYVDDPGGVFTLEGISRGPLVLLARADSSRGPLIGVAATDVAIGPVEEVRLFLEPPGSVGGRVVFDDPMPPDASLRVTLTHTRLTVSSLFPTEGASVGADGRFLVPHARGAYVIGVEHLPEGWRVVRIERQGTTLAGNRLLVAGSERVDGLEIHLGRDDDR